MQPYEGSTTQNVFGYICGEDTGEQADFDLSSVTPGRQVFWKLYRAFSHNRKVNFSTWGICEEWNTCIHTSLRST